MDVHWLQEVIIRELLLELVEEEAVNLLEEVIIEDEQHSDHVSEEITQIQISASRQIGNEILSELLAEECSAVAGDCFDDIIATHRTDLNVIRRMNNLLQRVTEELIEEIVLDTLEQKSATTVCETVANSVITEVMAEECNIISDIVVNHYRTRVAIYIQYRQMQMSASDIVLDTCLLESLLLPFSEGTQDIFSLQSEGADMVLCNALLDILLSQSLALDACSPKKTLPMVVKGVSSSKIPPVECIPLNWYKSKLTSSIAEDVVITMLCDRLDESIQVAAGDQMKNHAVSLVTEYLSR